MAKTRMMKPDIRTSVKVASWPREVRYFWTLLWGYVDDYGKGIDNALLVKADCFPLDEDITSAVMDCWLWRLDQDGVIARYEVDGKRFMQIVHWSEHQSPQHPKKSEIPEFNSVGATRCTMHAPCMNPSCIMHASFMPELSRDGLSRGVTDDAEPPLFCINHPSGANGKCGPCADARRIHDQWVFAQKNKPTPRPPRTGEATTAPHEHEYEPSGYCLRCGEKPAEMSA